MKRFALLCFLSVTLSAGFVLRGQDPGRHEPDPQDKRGLGIQTATPTPTIDQSRSPQSNAAARRPEIVLQAGVTSPQTRIAFSPDGRLLASMGMGGNSIKLWEVASGRLLRQLESSIPSMGASSMTRPFSFSADGKILTAFADGRLRRWEVDSGRELDSILIPAAKDLTVTILSEDGRTLAALNMNSSEVKLWDATAGRQLPSLALDQDEQLAGMDAIALSADGRLLAAVTEVTKASSKSIQTRRQLTIWETGAGRKTQTLPIKSTKTQFANYSQLANQTDAKPGLSLAFTSNDNAGGAWLAVRDESNMTIWDVASGHELKNFNTPQISVTGGNPGFAMFASKFLFSPNKQILSLVSAADKISLFDLTSTTSLHTLSGHTGNIVGLAFSADGKLFASSGTDNQIKLWDVANGREVKTLTGAATPIADIAFSADGRSLAVAGQQAVSYWELNTGAVRRAVVLPLEYISARSAMDTRGSVLSGDSRLMVAGSQTSPVVKVWDLGTGRELPGISLAPGKQLRSAAFTGDGKTLALVEGDLRKPAAATTQSTQTPSQPGLQSPGNSLPGAMAMPDMSKMMEMARKDPKKLQEEMKKVQDAMNKGDLGAGIAMIESMGIMPPGMNSAAKPANSLRLIDVASGRQLQTLPLPGGFLNASLADSMLSSTALSFSPDARILASASGFGAPVVLRDANSGQEMRSLKVPFSMSVSTIAWSPDGKRIASSHWGMKKAFSDPKLAEDFSFEDMAFSIKLWDAQTGTELNTLAGHNNFVNRIVFSADGRLLASGSYDSTIKLWDANTGSELRTLVGHSGSISALAFSPDGKFLVSGSDDGSARLWNTATGQMLATMVSINSGSDWLVVTPDGLFDGSPGGWNQILWRFTPTLFDVSPVEIFFNEYFRPGLLPDILAGKKLAVAADISQKDRRQPKLNLAIAGSANGSISTRTTKVTIDIADAPAGARDVRLFRNGSLVKVWRGDVLQTQAHATLETTAAIVAGENRFTAYAFNRDNVKSTDATITVNGAESLRRPGTFHLIVAGINQYSNPDYNLKYAVADAQAFAEEFARQQRKLGQYGQFEVTPLFDKDATKANLEFALGRLAGTSEGMAPAGAPADLDKISAAQPEDAVLLYFAGHGTAQDQRFYLIPQDLGYQGSRTELDNTGLTKILSHSISDLELEQSFANIDAGLMLLVIDACNSGQALEAEEKRRGPMNSKGLAQLAYEKGMYVLTAAQSYQAALEAEQLGHGYLTFALVEEGLKTVKADTEPADGQVLLREWLNYATERVPQMQAEKMRVARGLGIELAFVEGEEKEADVNTRDVQRPRVFYRRESEAQPLVVAKP